MKKHVLKIGSLLLLALMIVGGVLFLNVYTDYLELGEIGANFTKVFWTNFNVQLFTYLISFGVFLSLVLVNFLVLRANLLAIDSSFRYLKRMLPIVLVSVVISAVLAKVSMDLVSDKFLPFLTSEWFNLGDPIFHQDVGYYIFQRPFYVAVLDTLLTFCGFLIVATILIYVVCYARFDFYNLKQLLKERGVIIHTISGIMIFFLIKAVSYRFAGEALLYSDNKDFFGASFVDIRVWLTYYQIAPILLLAAVVVTIVCILRSKYKGAVITVLMYPASFLIAGIVAATMQTIVVSPNEMAMELPYYENNIQFTRAAYNLDQVIQQDYPVEHNLTGDKIMENLDTINNIRLTDFDQTLKVANQLQSIKNYYQFNDADIMLYELDGVKTAVTVAAREMNVERLDESAKNYINTKMKYTHGMGVVMSPVSRITEQGQPYFIIKDIPPRSIDGAPAVTQPRIYFGETAEDYSIVNTRGKELDEIDPSGFSYDGQAGIPLNLWNRVMYSFKLGDFKMLFSDQITADSKLLVNQNVLQRVKKAAPFLTIDNDPVIVVDDSGRLKWVVDAYTTSSSFPYAQFYGDFNYIRNSVKVVVDAYDGTVKFYIIDQNDPIIKSYARIYPTLFEQEPFPADLAQHMRYPEYLFKIQSEVLRKYHITNPEDFYQKKGMWSVAKEKYDEEKQPREVAPYYNLMKLTGDEEELVLMIPYTPVNKDNLTAWLAVSCTPEHYGEMVAYQFGENENVYGTYQIENRIDTDPQISQDLTLWSRSGSSVVRGNMMVIPVANNLLYVEPVYISSGEDEGALPEIKQIIVAYEDQVVARPTLDEALSVLFGVTRPELPGGEDETLEQVIQQVLADFDQSQQFLKQGDWENYGKSMNRLEDSMLDLRDKSGNNQPAEDGGQQTEPLADGGKQRQEEESEGFSMFR